MKRYTASSTGAFLGGISGALQGAAISIRSSNTIIGISAPSKLSKSLSYIGAVVTAALVKGAAGFVAGAQVGEFLDQSIFDTHICPDCDAAFQRAPASSQEATSKRPS
jgi:hypothetical protein